MKRAKDRKCRLPPGCTEDVTKNLNLITATREGNVDRVEQLLKDKKINVNVKDDLHPNKVVAFFVTNSYMLDKNLKFPFEIVLYYLLLEIKVSRNIKPKEHSAKQNQNYFRLILQKIKV